MGPGLLTSSPAATWVNVVLWYIQLSFLWIQYLKIVYFNNLQGDIL